MSKPQTTFTPIDSLQAGPWLDAVAWNEQGLVPVIAQEVGSKDGFDLALTAAVSDAVSVPVIASGGVGNLQHLVCLLYTSDAADE